MSMHHRSLLENKEVDHLSQCGDESPHLLVLTIVLD